MKIGTMGRLVTALAASLLLCSGASAQRGFGGAGGLGLLSRVEVQTELKMTEAQKAQVGELRTKMREQNQARFQELQNATPEQRQKVLAEIQADELKQANAILNADQQKRFKEIWLQQQGPAALAMPAIATEMNLTADQKTKIQSIINERNTQQQTLIQNAAGDFASIRDKMMALRTDTDTKIAAVLTSEQKARWTTMLGTTFNLPPPGGR
jgi:Spy/CpxP family protein refolding chaperone